MYRLSRFLIFLLLLSFVSGLHSQTNGILGRKFFNNWSVSLSGGPNVFFGDLKMNPILPSTTPPTDELRFAGTFSLNRQLSHVFMLRLQVLYGEIAGGKINASDGSPVNRFFEGNILEYNLNTTINLSNLFGKYNPKRFFFVYMTLGAGISSWNTKVRDINTQQPIYGKDSSMNWTYALVVPAGLGCYFSIRDKLNLGLEWTLRGVNSNQIDHSTQSNPYEAYSLLALTLTYNFNKPSSGSKLSAASPQKQIGPPPPQPVLAAEIAAEKQNEQILKNQASYPQLGSPVPAKDSLQPKQSEPVTDTIPKEEIKKDTNTAVAPETGISYRVQVFAIKENTFSAEQVEQKFKLSQPVTKEFSAGWYRYTIGSFATFSEAKKLMTGLQSKKQVHDAFIVKYIDGNRAAPSSSKTVKNSKGKKGNPKPATKE